MIDKKLKFSIITTVYNSEKYIEETIKSVVNQTAILENKVDYEYFIIDSASTDKTCKIIEKYEKIFPNIFFISEKDDGMYEGLAKGFEKSTGDIQCYLNSGDFYNLHCFDILSQIFKNKKINWVTGAKVLYNENSHITNYIIPYIYRRSLIKVGAYGNNLPFIQQESTFWRRKLMGSVDLGFLKKLKKSGDMYIWSKFSDYNNLYVLNSHLSGFKYHENQITFRETGTTDLYLEEAKKFLKPKTIYHYLLILFDAPFWFLSKYNSSLLSLLNNRHLSFNRNINKWDIQTNKNNNNLYCWACDFSKNQGEGILGRSFALDLQKNQFNCKVKSIFGSFNFDSDSSSFNGYEQKNSQQNFYEKYINPFIGIFYLWFKFLSGKKVCYINYLPLWNIFIFILLPPKTILGPVTGSLNTYSSNYFDFFFRKVLMKPMFKISIFFLNFRNQYQLFATKNLYSLFKNNKKLKKYSFNYVINNFFEKRPLEKVNFNNRNYDFCIYYRNYPTKNIMFFNKVLNFLISKGFKIIIVGDHFKSINKNGKLTNFGFVSNNKVVDLLKQTKFAILSPENTMSLFALDCIRCEVNLFSSSSIKNIPDGIKVLDLNPNNFEQSKEIILDYFSKINELPNHKLKRENNHDNFFSSWRDEFNI